MTAFSHSYQIYFLRLQKIPSVEITIFSRPTFLYYNIFNLYLITIFKLNIFFEVKEHALTKIFAKHL